MKIPEVIDSYRDFCLFAIIKNRKRNNEKIFDERQIEREIARKYLTCVKQMCNI